MLERLCGNEALKENLSAALAAGRLPHSVLLCGAGGLGKNFAARLLAADYLYPAGGPPAIFRILNAKGKSIFLPERCV